MPGEKSRIRNGIVQAAVELFRENGYDNVSVNAICQKAEVAHSSFYYLFSGKEDLLEYLLRDVMENKPVLTEDLLFAENDYERMWIICCRYLDICLSLGPQFTASMFRLELSDRLKPLEAVHTSDSWFIRFTDNCQKQGIMRTNMPAEYAATKSIDVVYKITYDWCLQKGAFNLKRKAREDTEIFFDIAPEYRMTEAQLEAL